MNRKGMSKALSLVFLSLLILLLPSGTFADEKSKLFIAIIEGHANPVFDGCVVTNTEEGGGFATRMGRITAMSEETAYFCSDPNRGVVNGEMVFENVKGDKLFLVYETLATIDPEIPEITFQGPYEVTGGTGRFENARGGGTIAGHGSLLPPFEVFAAHTGQIILIGVSH